MENHNVAKPTPNHRKNPRTDLSTDGGVHQLKQGARGTSCLVELLVAPLARSFGGKGLGDLMEAMVVHAR
jgi:hypothetical protein